MGQLPEEKIVVSELEEILKEIFMDNPEILKSPINGVPTDIRRLIRVYDYLKWGRK
ncbi:MAG: hypothetical protein ACI4DZ_11410 [Oliverpabstia sp.]